MKKILFLKLSIFLFFTSLYGQNLTFRSNLDYISNLSSIWGWTHPVNNKEYALVGARNGLSIVDITDPDNIEEVQFVFGTPCTWREMKTFGNYAYVVHDCTGTTAGLEIMDLSQLPDTVITYSFRTDGTIPDLVKAHTITIDEFGFAYINGHNIGNRGTLILDLNANPTQPTVVSQYSDTYVHDSYVKNNICYSAEIIANPGRFSIIDVSNKSNLQVLARQATPAGRCHNIWPSDDQNYVFTTDETTSINTTISSYDIRNLNDIQLLDQYNSVPDAIPHNVHILDDFAIVAHYTYGVALLDVAQPDKMVEIGHYDTAPAFEGNTYNGCWGVYPYFPSGTIVASDIENGLYVLTPEYIRSVHIRGVVSDAFTGSTIFDAEIKIEANSETYFSASDLSGKFKEGYRDAGTYEITISMDGYYMWHNSYNLLPGDVENLIVHLVPMIDAIDTIYADVEINQSVTVCNDNSTITVDTAFSCDFPYVSDFGSWAVDNNGCLIYNAFETTGNNIDSICMVFTNEDRDESVSSIVIISISNTINGISENGFKKDIFELLQNPVQDHLYIKSNLTKNEKLLIHIYDVNGKLLESKSDSGFNKIVSLPIIDYNKGLYILTIQSETSFWGSVKFIVQ